MTTPLRSGFFYLATPYSNYPAGRDAACEHAADVAARLVVDRDLLVYSPIAHTHELAKRRSLPGDASFWQRFDEALMRPAIGAIVPEMPGWFDSVGVGQEITWMRANHKPVVMLEWPTLAFSQLFFTPLDYGGTIDPDELRALFTP